MSGVSAEWLTVRRLCAVGLGVADLDLDGLDLPVKDKPSISRIGVDGLGMVGLRIASAGMSGVSMTGLANGWTSYCIQDWPSCDWTTHSRAKYDWGKSRRDKHG